MVVSVVYARARLINKYGRDRKNSSSWDRGLIEDITYHQLWELQQPFYFAAKEAKPMGLMREVVIDLFPDIVPDTISLLSEVSVNGGKAMCGDVVAFFEGDQLGVGQVLLVVGFKSTSCSSCAFIAKWAQVEMNDQWWTCKKSDDNVVQIKTACLDTVLLHTSTALQLFVPAELRPWLCMLDWSDLEK